MKRLLITFSMLWSLCTLGATLTNVGDINVKNAFAANMAWAAQSWTYSATYFTNIVMTNALAGITNADRGLVSLWLRLAPGVSQGNAYFVQVGQNVTRCVNPELGHRSLDPSGAGCLQLYADGPDTNWHHMILSWDHSTAGRAKIYVDGVSKNTLIFTVPSTNDNTSVGCEIGGQIGYGPTFTGDLCEVYWDIPPAYYDLTDTNNLQKFRSPAGKPVNLGADGSTPTGQRPFIYLHDAYTSFTNNYGIGGHFKLQSGTLSASSSTP